MLVGYYFPNVFESSVSPWTTLGPLAIVVGISLMQQGAGDLKRHSNDRVTNTSPCVIFQRTDPEELPEMRNANIFSGKPLEIDEGMKVSCCNVPRMDIKAGNIVLVRNRDMIPADLVLLASSNDGGSCYIETSPIDGETNLKLRMSPAVPDDVLTQLTSDRNITGPESLDRAVKRIARMSYLGVRYPEDAVPAHMAGRAVEELSPPVSPTEPPAQDSFKASKSKSKLRSSLMKSFKHSKYELKATSQFVASLNSEVPNASVNTFSGKLTLPPMSAGAAPTEIAVDADNFLLRGAFLRNTEWVLGVACFTGKDTKLVMNSFDTPSKFSQLDHLVNRTVVRILMLFLCCVILLGGLAVHYHGTMFDTLWYCGYNKATSDKWPYLTDMETPIWTEEHPNFIQFALTYSTLISNLVPLSLYVTMEFVTFFMIYLIYKDISIYHDITDTAAAARNTNVTDLGQVQYVFSDKTGTLTQNVMRFKRCSVEGQMYGKPVQTSSPTSDLNDNLPSQDYQSLKQLTAADRLNFDAEMFLRVMSICHTVVVEKEFQKNIEIDEENFKSEQNSLGSKMLAMLTPRRRKNSADSTKNNSSDDSATVTSATENIESSNHSLNLGVGKDGAPKGFAYQAESPDEGALVSAASLEYGFQLLGRDSKGVKLVCCKPSILQQKDVVTGLREGTISTKQLAASPPSEENVTTKSSTETWAILAINKFDSTRKRMSVLVRSPPELGSIPILFCKGADSAMLDPAVCDGPLIGTEGDVVVSSSGENIEVVDHEESTMLGIQSHLGTFASEGLRTLVLGLRILTDEQCNEWLEEYTAASTSINNRDELLTKAALNIEKKLHIVGATAIEDKLQDGVPETIQKLGKSGIKLWVLTGDKRETAIEIGYSTRVLTPSMHVSEVAESPSGLKVKTKMAMEFFRLVKMGKLPEYQKSKILQQKQTSNSFLENLMNSMSLCLRSMSRGWSRFYIKNIFTLCGKFNRKKAQKRLDAMDAEDVIFNRKKDPVTRRAYVRNYARSILSEWLQSPEGHAEHQEYITRKMKMAPGNAAQDEMKEELRDDDEDVEVANIPDADGVPDIFSRAMSASMKIEQKRLSKTNPLGASLLSMKQRNLVDETVLSMASIPADEGTWEQNFNKSKNHALERIFSTDREVRNGQLFKHLTPEKREQLARANGNSALDNTPTDVSRALVIEGAALSHLLGNDLLEEIFFAVASQCDSVIACRVSPKQKALLVNLVQNYVEPIPVTLAIGDGANDVGMIQEAHIGVGISGLEGQQAVNASDFSIAQFRFLEELLLIHGRWNFSRMSRVILFSFYKNAVLAVSLMVYASSNIYSGTPLFDQWVLSMFNFIAFFPILFLGFFDRDLEKDYVKKNPQVYAPGPNNEYITNRTILRWVSLVFIHTFLIYYSCMPCITRAGGMTSAFKGLMSKGDIDHPGDGEGGDLKVFGTTLYTVLMVVLCYKVRL